MPKILSQSGTSLADTYDVEGSIAGVENLESQDVHLFDEMGGRVFSERLQTFLVEGEAAGVLQNATFAAVLGGVPDSPNRLLGLTVITDAVARLTDVQVSAREVTPAGAGAREFPIWVWDNTAGTEVTTTWDRDGAGVAAFDVLIPVQTQVPTLITRLGVAKQMGQLIMRGLSSGFGAGTVDIIICATFCRANPGNPAPGEPSSHGLPLPGW